jgi:hypothetical protein
MEQENTVIFRYDEAESLWTLEVRDNLHEIFDDNWYDRDGHIGWS